MKAYRLSALAQTDVDAIWDYLTEQAGTATAERFILRLYELLSLLGQNPGMGRFPLDNFLVYYRVEKGRVLVARILHGSRRQRKAFQAE